MGLFDFLFGKAAPPPPRTCVYRTDAEKWLAISKAIEECRPETTAAALLVGHFPDTVARLQEVAATYTGSVPILCTLAEDCQPEMAERLHLQPELEFVVLVAERHLIPEPDDEIAKFASSINANQTGKEKKCRVIYHISLDDPVMRIFAGSWVRDVLDKMGMEEGEAIESPMVTRRILQAQQKLSEKKQSNRSADNADAWIDLNLPAGSVPDISNSDDN